MGKTHLGETLRISQNLDSFTLYHGKVRSICCNNNSDRAIISNDVGLQDILLSELHVHQFFLTRIKKDLSMLLAFLLSS